MPKNLLALVLTCICCTGCMTTPALPEQQRPSAWAQPLDAQHNFYQVSPILFRSEQPDQQLAALLQQHEIDVVINLRPKATDAEPLQQHGLQSVHLPIHTWAIDREDLLQVMQQIQTAQAQQQKVLIHCYHGADRTGASVAMYRIMFEDWSVEQALAEMKYGGFGFHPIWVNIDALFRPENIKWIRQQLSNPSNENSRQDTDRLDN
ncbi:dual specificity protein phosphatase family protein [Acinetobacter indicus]|uniref:dual specificity protein phosphatase family protein n=1 Tax=Acinetobacter indicus TaxID=756892 RepID=UPI000CEC8BC7|nr:dual specificity protein phosphatase family protein [Acinetobacter indicus]